MFIIDFQFEHRTHQTSYCRLEPIRDDDVVDTPYPEVNQELDLLYSEVNIANIESTIAFTQIVGFESEAVEETANEVKGG